VAFAHSELGFKRGFQSVAIGHVEGKGESFSQERGMDGFDGGFDGEDALRSDGTREGDDFLDQGGAVDAGTGKQACDGA
jgi:hypothetical protein